MEERYTGVLEKYNCKVIGTPIETIIATEEDREIVSQQLQAMNERLALSYSAVNIEEEAVECAKKIGFPYSQTLSNNEYCRLCQVAMKVIGSVGIVGDESVV